ncbi:MAG: Hpt domain-containing protein, partial [Roseomonas sp.]|nr:Hpt domain-containing protein [Roseomonas sp.]
QDLPRLRHAAHRLLGAARTLGARRLAAVTEFMQAELHAGRDPNASLRQVLEVAAATLPLVEAPLNRQAMNDTIPPARLAQGVGD